MQVNENWLTEYDFKFVYSKFVYIRIHDLKFVCGKAVCIRIHGFCHV